MIEHIDKDKSQGRLRKGEKNYWCYNNYARLKEIDNKRFECWGIITTNSGLFATEDFVDIVNKYSRNINGVIKGYIDTENEFYKADKFRLPFDWEFSVYALNVLYFYKDDLVLLDDSNNRGTVTIKPYLEERATNENPFYHPNLEEVARRKIKDLWYYRDSEYGRGGVCNYFDFHLSKYKGSIVEFLKYTMSFMLALCIDDTIENIQLFNEFKNWHDGISKKLGISILQAKDSVIPNASTTYVENNSITESKMFQNSLSQFINEINSLELVNTDVSYSYYAEKNLLSPPAIRPHPENYADDTITVLAIDEDMKFYPSAIKELTTKVHTELILMDSVKRNEILGHLEKRLNELEAVTPLIWQLHDDLFIREEYIFLSKTMPMCKLDITLFSEFLEKYYNLKIPYNIGTRSSQKLSVIETQYGLAYITGQLFYDMLKRNRSQCDELKQLIEKLNQLTRNPTTSATVEESKEVEIIDFVKDIKPCDEFDKLFLNDIKGKIEVWNYMILLKMIDQDGNYIPIGKTSIIRAFVVLMRKHFKLPLAKTPDELIKIFGIKLSISDKLRIRQTTEIGLKEQELVRLLNASETKTLTFTYVD